MYSLEEAVARFFPAGTGYDRNQAKRLIRWLDSCGYTVVPKDQVYSLAHVSELATKLLPDRLRSVAANDYRKSALQ